MLEFEKISREDQSLINKIAKRAKTLIYEIESDLTSVMMDISAVHLNIGLRLRDLLESDPPDFAHDIIGIVNNINRKNDGQIEGLFHPRYAEDE